MVASGRAKVVWENAAGGELFETELQPGLGYSCEAGQRHRLMAITDCDIIEVSTPEVGITHRLQDDYNRGETNPSANERVRTNRERQRPAHPPPAKRTGW